MTDLRDIFDDFEEDFALDEQTIVEDLGIAPRVIEQRVLNDIHSQRSRHKKHHYLTTFLIAAAISAALVGTTVIAGQLFKPDFNGKFDGDVSALVVHEPQNFFFEPLNNNLEAYFGGIVGDEDTAVASVLLTKKDNTPFLTDEDGILQPVGTLMEDLTETEIWKEPSDYNFLASLRDLKEPTGLDYEYVFYTKNSEHVVMSESCTAVDVRLNEDRTEMTMYINVNVTNDETQGGAASLSFDHFFAYETVGLLAAYQDAGEQSQQQAESLCDRKGIDLHKNCRWVYEDGQYCLYYIERIRYDLPFDMSFTMNYRTENPLKTMFSAAAAPTLLRENNNAMMMLTPFQLTLSAQQLLNAEQITSRIKDYCLTHHCSEEVTQDLLFRATQDSFPETYTLSAIQQEWQGTACHVIDSARSFITMKDGRVYYLVLADCTTNCFPKGNEHLDVEDSLTFFYSDVPIEKPQQSDMLEEIQKTSVLSLREVSKVCINGHLLYQHPAEDTSTVPL